MLALLPIFAALKSVGTSVLTFLARLNPWQLALIALGLFALVQHFELAHARRQAVNYSRQLERCTSARHADQLAYSKAQSDAQAKNRADVARDKAERERITNDISQSYEGQIASLRADLARRLRSPNPAAPSAPGGSGLPDVSQAPSGADGSARVSIPSGLYVRGAELELQLEQLQQWVNKQLSVNPNR